MGSKIIMLLQLIRCNYYYFRIFKYIIIENNIFQVLYYSIFVFLFFFII